MRSRSTILVCGIVVLYSASLADAEVPTPLRERSVLLNWTEERSFDPVNGQGIEHQDVVEGNAIIYLGALGHIFSRIRSLVSPSQDGHSLGQATSSNEIVSGATKDAIWQIAGHSLEGSIKFKGGVERISVSLDNEFRSCKMTIQYRKPSDSTRVIMEGWRNDLYYLTASALKLTTCSIRQGNALGGQSEMTSG